VEKPLEGLFQIPVPKKSPSSGFGTQFESLNMSAEAAGCLENVFNAEMPPPRNTQECAPKRQRMNPPKVTGMKLAGKILPQDTARRLLAAGPAMVDLLQSEEGRLVVDLGSGVGVSRSTTGMSMIDSDAGLLSPEKQSGSATNLSSPRAQVLPTCRAQFLSNTLEILAESNGPLGPESTSSQWPDQPSNLGSIVAKLSLETLLLDSASSNSVNALLDLARVEGRVLMLKELYHCCAPGAPLPKLLKFTLPSLSAALAESSESKPPLQEGEISRPKSLGIGDLLERERRELLLRKREARRTLKCPVTVGGMAMKAKKRSSSMITVETSLPSPSCSEYSTDTP